jgi:hypothetical protein
MIAFRPGIPSRNHCRFGPWISAGTKVARWYIFIPKLRIWVDFGGPWNGKCWHILLPIGIFYGNLIYFMVIWYNLWSFWYIFPCFGMMYQGKSGNPVGNLHRTSKCVLCSSFFVVSRQRFLQLIAFGFY